MGPPIERRCQVSVEMGPPIERRCQVSNPLIKRNPPKFINFRPAEVWSSMLILTGICAQHVSSKWQVLDSNSLRTAFLGIRLISRLLHKCSGSREQLTSWEQVSEVLRFHQIKPWHYDISFFKNKANVIEYLIKHVDSDNHSCATCFSKKGHSGGKYWSIGFQFTQNCLSGRLTNDHVDHGVSSIIEYHQASSMCSCRWMKFQWQFCGPLRRLLLYILYMHNVGGILSSSWIETLCSNNNNVRFGRIFKNTS